MESASNAVNDLEVDGTDEVLEEVLEIGIPMLISLGGIQLVFEAVAGSWELAGD